MEVTQCEFQISNVHTGENSKYKCYINVKTVFPEFSSLLCRTAFVNAGVIIL
jgi:hypothetical protein